MNDSELLNYIKSSIITYISLDFYDIDILLERLGITLTGEERDNFEDDFLNYVRDLDDDYIDQIAYDALIKFKELLKDKLPRYPEDALG